MGTRNGNAKTRAEDDRNVEIVDEALNRLRRGNPAVAERTHRLQGVVDFRNRLV